MINELVQHQGMFRCLKSYLPHFVIIPVGHNEPHRVFMKILTVAEHYKLILERYLKHPIPLSEDSTQITYQIVQISPFVKMKLEPVVGRYTLLIDLSEELLQLKRILQHHIKTHTICVLLSNQPADSLKDRHLFSFLNSIDPKLERVVCLLQSQEGKLRVEGVMESLRIKHFATSLETLHTLLNNVCLHSLKFQFNEIYRTVTSQYHQFTTTERSWKELEILKNSVEHRDLHLHQCLLESCKTLSQSIQGEYSNGLSNYQGSSLRGYIMTLLNSHFKYLKEEYVNIINNLTYGDVRKAIERYDSVPLDGFLTIEQFNAAFQSVVEFLRQESLVVLAQVHELILQATQVAFKRGMKMFQDSDVLSGELQKFLEEVRDQCFNVITDAVMTIIHEVYFNDSMDIGRVKEYRTIKDQVIWEVKRIGVIYYRNVILQIQDTIARNLLSKYMRVVQEQILKTVLNLMDKGLVSSQLNPDYIESVQTEYLEARSVAQLYRQLNSDPIINYYRSVKLEEQMPIEEPPVQQITKARFRDRIKRFFGIGSKKPEAEQVGPRVVKFSSSQPRHIHRSKSPESGIMESNRTSMASDFLLGSRLDQDIEPLSVAEWLRISMDDRAFRDLPTPRLRV